jgi:hypothetical protein
VCDGSARAGLMSVPMDCDNDLSRRLAVCPDCYRNYVVPLDGHEQHEQMWWLELRCGWCGARRSLLASEQETFDLCEEVDLGLSRLAVAADRLHRQHREAEIEVFAAALARDLITSDDFGSPTNR